MQATNQFLVEIHTEELPPKSLHTLGEHFLEGIKTRLQKADLTFGEATFFATPRRLAVFIKELNSQQPDKSIERKGPALDRAYDSDGKPTPACIGFAKSCGIEVSELITLPGNFVGCKQDVKGKTVFELMPLIIEEALAGLPIPKPMRWGNHSHKFIRPVHSVILMYGDKIIDAEILGCKTGNKTRGHRFLHPEWISISHPEQYAAQLQDAFVIADFATRREKIKTDALALVENKFGKTAILSMNDNLLDEVTSIVEWPKAVCGSFDKNFLNVPLEALTSAMQDHQRYFPILSEPNKLLPNFITISNIQCEDDKRVVAGNERVLRARLSDAAFFYETDKKTSLAERVEILKTIVFQNKLGTLFDKTQRVQKLTALIAKDMHEDTALAERAALLSKTDLTTDLVGEFPELQGIAGYYYALNDKESPAIAKAMSEQYKPRFSGDTLPETNLACALAIADRLDTLVGVFGINQAPTGDKDPFGLRRAALGILRILIEKKFSLDLRTLITSAAENFSNLENKNVVNDTLQFILERLKPWYQEQQISANVIASVMTLNLTTPYDIHNRIQAVMAFKNLPEAEALSAANKRVSNILTKSDHEMTTNTIQENLFENDAERELAETVEAQSKSVATLSQSAQYQEVLSQLAKLRTPVDNFFDHVMVMTEDKPRRENRLLILKKLRGLFLQVADIALLQ
jgi:glycyl-tRNA synthetase beta chain